MKKKESFNFDPTIHHLLSALRTWEEDPRCGMREPPEIRPFPPDPCFYLHLEGKCRFQGYGKLPPGPCFANDEPPKFSISFDPETLERAAPATKKQLQAMMDAYPGIAEAAFKEMYKVVKLFEAMNGIIKTAQAGGSWTPVPPLPECPNDSRLWASSTEVPARAKSPSRRRKSRGA